MTDRDMFWIAVMMLCAVILAFFLVLVTRPAHGSPVCLTKREARALWPRQHLYWYSGDHCWSNRRGAPRNLRYDLIRENHAQSLPASTVDAGEGSRVVPPQRNGATPTIFYPGVSYAGLPVPRVMMDHAPSTLTYRLLDIDEITARIPDPPDECCWPELVPDGKGGWKLK